MNKRQMRSKGQGVKFDDCTDESSGSLISTERAGIAYIIRKAEAYKNFMQAHAKSFKYAAILGGMCLTANEAYAVDIVATFNENIVIPIHTLAKDNYGKGIGIIAMGYMVLSEGADMRTKATRAGVGALFGYGLGNLLFGA